MPTLTSLKIHYRLGVLTGSVGVRVTLVPLKLKYTIGVLTGFSGPRVGHLAPLRLRWTLGRLRGIEHDTGTPVALNEALYNGTTYRVEMTGYHVGLSTLVIPARTIVAEEGGVKETRAVTEYLPVLPPIDPGPGVPPIVPGYAPMTGVAVSSDYAADLAVIGDTRTTRGAVIDSVALTDDVAGNVYSALWFQGPKILRHLMSGTTQRLIQTYTFTGPRIHQLRAIPGEGFAVVTDVGFYFCNTAFTVQQPRNGGIVDPGGGRLSLLADGSLIIYMTGNRVYKSTDLGAHWTDTSSNLPFIGQTLRDIYVATATHWWLASTAGIWKTTNGGSTWILSNGNLEAQIGIFRGDSGLLSVHGLPSAPHTVVIGLPGKVARTTNGGSTWAVFGTAQGLGAKPAPYRVHQAGAVIIAGYGAFYEESPVGYVWRSANNGASWQTAFPGTTAAYAKDINSSFGFSSDLVVIGTPKGPPQDDSDPDDPRPPKPWTRTVISYREVFRRSSAVTVTASVDAATLAAITARAVIVGEQRARLLIRQVKAYRTQKRTDIIASGVYRSIVTTSTSLGGNIDITLTARDTNVQQQFHHNRVAREIPDTGIVVGSEQVEGDLVLSMLIDESIRPQTRISWLGSEYIVKGIVYAISDSARLMSLNTGVRLFAVPTSDARDGVSKELPRFTPPKVTAKRSKVLGGSRGSGGKSSGG